MNITKAIADHAPAAMQELIDERRQLVARITAINLELAMWQTLQGIVEAADAPPVVVT